jgi:hypothetical protein
MVTAKAMTGGLAIVTTTPDNLRQLQETSLWLWQALVNIVDAAHPAAVLTQDRGNTSPMTQQKACD